MKTEVIIPDHFPPVKEEDLIAAAERREKYSILRDLQAIEFNGAIVSRMEKDKEKAETARNEEKKLIPLEIGLLVNDILVEHFPAIVDIGFTASIEEDFDKIAEGEKEWVPVIRNFYKPFHKNIDGI